MVKITKQLNWLEKILRFTEKLIPKKLYSIGQPIYHYLLSLLAAIIYRFPARKLIVVAITGTKGKTSTAEILNAILEERGYKTAILSTLRFKVGRESERNMYKMTTPGRFAVQRFLRRAVSEKCQYAIMEVTSQAVLQSRHKFLNLDALIFTNISPEHIESHGSFENYLDAKLKIGKALAKSRKKRRILVANGDDKESAKFLSLNIPEKFEFSLSESKPHQIKKEGLEFTYEGVNMLSHLSGEFNLYNILSAITYARTQNISLDIIKKALENFKGIRGRVEFVELDPGDPARDKQDFKVVVDYAHTPDSLEKLYEVFQGSKNICVLGNTGGGRDKWKRKEMAQVAERHCSHIILTNEDPYDEDPETIVDEMIGAIKRPIVEKVMDRREAIRKALKMAKTGDSVLITGKGTDPYIMGPNGTKLPWDDADVVREELKKISNSPNF
jgi:UDP-N-acetylmuramoyl-L-alanyl-D-glutamate--2,6-diaminopimelate ligase